MTLTLNYFSDYTFRREKWFTIFGNRLSILVAYKPEKMPIEIVLFKADQLFAEYQSLQEYAVLICAVMEEAMGMMRLVCGH